MGKILDWLSQKQFTDNGIMLNVEGPVMHGIKDERLSEMKDLHSKGEFLKFRGEVEKHYHPEEGTKNEL